jgi:hypothetical protein
LEFLKRHYEKMILAVLLMAFIFSLIYLIKIITSTNVVRKEDLKIPTRAPDYQIVNFDSSLYDMKYVFTNGTAWLPSKARSKGSRLYTDLIIPVKSDRCPHCKKIVPDSFFRNEPHKCPICSKPLPRPTKKRPGKTHVKVTSVNDVDNDGIPNAIEEKLGLDAKNPADANYDMDGDGFSNLCEFMKGTLINNPKSHPPMYLRLRLIALRRTEIDATLKKVIASGKNKSNWDIQINTNGGKKTKFLILGDMLRLDNKYYKIVDVEHKVEKGKSGTVAVLKDDSTVTLQSNDGKDKIVMRVDKTVYSPNPKAIVEDVSTGQEYKLDTGDKFKVGSTLTGFTSYKVKEIDTEKERIKIYGGKKKKVYAYVTKQLQIPKVESKETKRTPEFGDMPGNPEMMDPRMRQNKNRNTGFPEMPRL